MRKVSVLLSTLLFAIMFAMVPAASHAYLIFFGEDLNDTEFSPLAAIPNSSAAETNFLSYLTGVGTEDFEGIAPGTTASVNLNFPGAGTVTLIGGNGSVASVSVGTTNGFGRYSIPSSSSTNFGRFGPVDWEILR